VVFGGDIQLKDGALVKGDVAALAGQSSEARRHHRGRALQRPVAAECPGNRPGDREGARAPDQPTEAAGAMGAVPVATQGACRSPRHGSARRRRSIAGAAPRGQSRWRRRSPASCQLRCRPADPSGGWLAGLLLLIACCVGLFVWSALAAAVLLAGSLSDSGSGSGY